MSGPRSNLAPRPAHVPESLVYDFDLFNDLGMGTDPSARFLDLLKTAPPVFWTPRYGGRWVLASNEAVVAASRDFEIFSSVIQSRKEVEAGIPDSAPRPPNPAPIGMDPPEHGIYRAVLQRYFSPRRMTNLTSKIQRLAIELIEALKGRGEAEFVESFCTPLPVNMFLELLGLPVERRTEYRELVEESMDFGDPRVTNIPKRLQQIADVLRPTILERQSNPKDDLISAIWQSDMGGRPATYEDVVNLAVVVFIAGHDTVKNAIGFALIHLARNPDLQRNLREDPSLIPAAREEMLRRYAFVVNARRIQKDTVFKGVQMKANEIAMVCHATAYLDASVVENPERYDLNRKVKTHLAFGLGIHRCVGMHLARIELQVAYQEILSRLPEFRLDPKWPLRYHAAHATGPVEIWLKWNV